MSECHCTHYKRRTIGRKRERVMRFWRENFIARRSTKCYSSWKRKRERERHNISTTIMPKHEHVLSTYSQTCIYIYTDIIINTHYIVVYITLMNEWSKWLFPRRDALNGWQWWWVIATTIMMIFQAVSLTHSLSLSFSLDGQKIFVVLVLINSLKQLQTTFYYLQYIVWGVFCFF